MASRRELRKRYRRWSEYFWRYRHVNDVATPGFIRAYNRLVYAERHSGASGRLAS